MTGRPPFAKKFPRRKGFKKPFKGEDERVGGKDFETEELDSAIVDTIDGLRILCISNVRGSLLQINTLVQKLKADIVIHTGSFGFFDGDSADSMDRHALASAANASPVVSGEHFENMGEERLRETVGSQLSELPLFLARAEEFIVPVYTIWGSSDDISVIEKFRAGTYEVPNLHLVDEYNAPLIPNTSIRLLGLPGWFKKSQFFHIADGTTVPGRAGSTWAGIWQIGELLHTFVNTYSATETRVFLSSANPLMKPLLNYISLLVRSQFTISSSGQQHSSSFSDGAVHGNPRAFVRALNSDRDDLLAIWQNAKAKVFEQTEDFPELRELIVSTIDILSKKGDDSDYVEERLSNKWNFNLGDVSSSKVILTVASNGTISPTIINKPFKLLQKAERPDHPHPRFEEAFGRGDSKISKESLSNKTTSSINSSASTGVLDSNIRPSSSPTISAAKLAKAAEKKKQKLKQKEKKKQKLKDEQAIRRPGLWFKNGDRSSEEILSFLAEEDRKANPQVEFSTTTKPNGLKSKVALVFFETADQASGAYERADKDAAGTVSIYQPEQHHQHHSRKSLPKELKH